LHRLADRQDSLRADRPLDRSLRHHDDPDDVSRRLLAGTGDLAPANHGLRQMSEQRPVIYTAGLWPAYVDAGYVEKLRGYVAANITPEGDRIDREDVYPTGIMKDLARSRYSTVVMDTEFGGEGLSYPH